MLPNNFEEDNYIFSTTQINPIPSSEQQTYNERYYILLTIIFFSLRKCVFFNYSAELTSQCDRPLLAHRMVSRLLNINWQRQSPNNMTEKEIYLAAFTGCNLIYRPQNVFSQSS